MKKYIIYILVFVLNTIQALSVAQNYIVDTSKDVGDILYETRVTPQGALTYNVPIECFQSPGGLQPNISFVYNSMSGMGAVGMGWSIGGLSSISRVNSSEYYDGKVSVANFSDTCAFALDGVRLVKKPGTDYLVTEQGNILVKQSKNQYNGDIQFEVLYPNGNKAVYRRNWLDDCGIAISYPLIRMEDKLGNWISYKYVCDNRIPRISSIYYYTYNSSDWAGVMHFTYKSIDVPSVPIYFFGEKIGQSKILDRIQVQGESALDNTYDYTLSYDYDSKNDVYYLDKISKMSVGSNKELNPLVFNYGRNKEEKLEVSKRELVGYPTTLDSIVALIPVKFSSKEATNGLIVMPEKSTYNWDARSKDNPYWQGNAKYDDTDSAYVYRDLATKEEAFRIQLTGTPIKGSGDEVGWPAILRGVFTIDYKGNGDTKILKVSEKTRDWEESESNHLLEIYGSTGIKEDEFQSRVEDGYAKVYPNLFCAMAKSYLIGDFVGDGYESLLYITYNRDVNDEKRASKAVFIDINKKGVLYDKECFGVHPKDILTAIDFDGDGKNEILHINGDGVSVYKFDLNSGFEKIAGYNNSNMLPWTYNDSKKISEIYLFADINGDGKTDIIRSPMSAELQFHKTDKNWVFYLSNGKDGFSVIEQDNIELFYPDYKYTLQDMDGNGFPDLVVLDKEGTVSVHKNIKGKFFTTPDIAPEKVDKRGKLVMSRVREANKLYPIMGVKGSKLTLISNSVNEQENRLMSSSVNSYGVESKYNYGTLTNKEICSVGENDSVAFPYNYIVEDIFVLKDIETSLNNTKLSSASYKYHNPVVHRQGLGFRGFEQITITDNLRDKSTIQKYDPQLFGALTSIQTLTTVVKSDYEAIFSENKRVQLLLKKEVIQNILKGTTVTSDFKYDSYGNLTEKSVDYGDGIKSETSYQLSNVDNSTTYLLGLLKEEKQVNTRGGASYSGKTVIDYNSNYLPVSKKSYYENNLVSEEKYIYDASNNLEQLETRNYDSPDWLTTKYEYDEQGRKVKETDPLGFTTEYIYNGKSLLQSVKNHKGHTVSYEYDRWGHNSKTTYADGTTQTTLLAWETSLQGAVFSITNKKSGEPDTKTYFDALGREIRTGAQRFDGSYLYTDNVYDELGRLKKNSLPFKSSPSLWNESTYDSYDRIKTVTYASGKKDSYAYNKLKVKSTIDGIESTKVYDVSGEVIRITDASGSITYNLRTDGQPESIVAPGDITTSFEYDKYGRQTAIVDPSAGTKKYEYDIYGNINKETDARGKVTNLTYDKYGRSLQKEIVGEFSTAYKYNADNLIESEISTNGTAKNYTYDNLFRLKTQKESIVDGKWLEQTFDYQADGNIGSVAYKSQNGLIATENYEYSNGHHTELKLDNTHSIWKLTAENDLGMPVSSVTGVIDRQYTYDAYGLPTGRILKNGSSTIQDFGYQFEVKTGNLLWRKDNTRNIREDFTYDNLNRLTRFGGTTIQYNNQGNIIDHSAVGYFSYSQTKPYAIEKIEPYSAYLYPEARKQEITYNALMRPVSISENGYRALLSYDTNGNRVKMNLTRNDTLQLNRYYVGGVYEIDETLAGNTERLYLGGDAYSAAAVYIKESGSWKVNYIGRDYLGSITHVMDQTGIVRQKLSYDPWGRLRDPLTQALFEFDKRLTLVLGDRGYTGHEHLQEFGLINMNARLYDPVVGRFLSPDPYVQAPDFSQNFNRYSYALNNPLRFTDPSGEFWHFVVAALVGGAINWYSNGADFTWEGLTHFGIGALAGAATLAAPSAFAYISAGAAFASNWAHQAFNPNPNGDGINYLSAAFDGTISGVTAYGIGKALKIPGVSKALNKLTGGITSPLLRQMANSYAVGLPLGTGMGAVMGALDENSTAGEGAWRGFKSSMVTSTISGIGSAAQYSLDNEVNIFSGRLNEDKLVHKAGLKAQDNIGGKGAVAGTAKHEYAGSLIERYQSIYGNRGLEIEYRFKDQGYGAGRLDVYSPKTNSIYDWKFGYPNKTIPQLMKTPQMIKYQNTFPDAKITIFKF